jgi:hypothetical protein
VAQVEHDVGAVARGVGRPTGVEGGDARERRARHQVQRREVEEGPGRRGLAEHEGDRVDLRLEPAAQDLLGHRALELGGGRRRVAQGHGAAEQRRQALVHVRVGRPCALPAGQLEHHVLTCPRGGAAQQALPSPRLLRAGDLPRGPVDDRAGPVAGQPALGHLGLGELLPEHRLDGIAPQRRHGSRGSGVRQGTSWRGWT